MSLPTRRAPPTPACLAIPTCPSQPDMSLPTRRAPPSLACLVHPGVPSPRLSLPDVRRPP
eukprot:364146-Chlamydomonas_euryale.AAC.1